MVFFLKNEKQKEGNLISKKGKCIENISKLWAFLVALLFGENTQQGSDDWKINMTFFKVIKNQDKILG